MLLCFAMQLPKLELTNGIAEFELIWNEEAKSPGPQPQPSASKPRSMRPDGHSTATVIVKSIGKGSSPKSGSEVDVTFKHSVPARAVLAARPWNGEGKQRTPTTASAIGARPLLTKLRPLIELHGPSLPGPDALEALVGKPLSVMVLLVDRFGCVCSHEQPRTVRVLMQGAQTGEHPPAEVVCTSGVGELILSRTIAEAVTFSVVEEDRVIEAAENDELYRRVQEAKMPLLKFFVDETTVDFRHGTPCALRVELIPDAAIGTRTTPAASGTAQLPLVGPSAPAKAPAAHGVSSEGGGVPEHEHLDVQDEENGKRHDGSAPSSSDLELVAGCKLTGLVQAIDAFGNPATSPVWWKGKGAVTIILEEEALPKSEDQTLGGRQLSKNAVPTLPVTNGSVKHTVAQTGHSLKREINLTLDNGQVKTPIHATIAGELRLSAAMKSDGKSASKFSLLPGSMSAQVVAAAAEMFDLVPLDQTTGGMRVVVHARDAYGNLDETCDREVLIELDRPDAGKFVEPFAFDVPDGGLVKLEQGVAELKGIRAKEACD